MILKKLVAISSFCIATLLAFVPFNFIIGSKFAWFSCSMMTIPALGSYYSLVYVIFYIFTKSLCSFKLSALLLMHRLPLLTATLALKKQSWYLHIGLPICMMILFCVHPVGSQVYYYSWYWFIPIFLYVFAQDHILSRAMSASYIAHAVGSVVWLYGKNIPAEIWTALMPIVFIERLIIAAGMVASMYCLQALVDFYKHKVIA